jgi:hypothetical protein
MGMPLQKGWANLLRMPRTHLYALADRCSRTSVDELPRRHVRGAAICARRVGALVSPSAHEGRNDSKSE